MLAETVGAATCLYLVTALTPEGESFVGTISMLIFLSLIAAFALLLLPETAHRELEEISEQ